MVGCLLSLFVGDLRVPGLGADIRGEPVEPAEEAESFPGASLAQRPWLDQGEGSLLKVVGFGLEGAPTFGGISKLLFQNSITYFLVNQSLIWKLTDGPGFLAPPSIVVLKADVFDLLKCQPQAAMFIKKCDKSNLWRKLQYLTNFWHNLGVARWNRVVSQ